MEVDDPLACFRSARQCRQAVLDAVVVIPHWQELADSPPPRDEEPEPQSTQGRTATAGHREVGTEVCTRGGVACSQRQHKGIDAFAARPGFRTIDCAPHVKGNPTRGPTVPRLPVQTFAPASLPLSMRTCRCGRQLDMFGHHRAACAVAGVLGRRCFPLEVAAAQVCREAGARTSETWIWPSSTTSTDDVWRSSQMGSICGRASSPKIRLWSFHSAVTGLPGPRAADHDGAALEEARRKERTHPELSWDRGGARLSQLGARRP